MTFCAFCRRLSEYKFGQTSVSAKTSSSPSPTVGSQSAVDSSLPAPPPPVFTQGIATIAAVTAISSSPGIVSKDPPSSSDAEVEEELNKLAISQRNSESSASEMCALPPPTPTPPPITKVTPPPPDENIFPHYQSIEVISCESSQSDLVCGAERSAGSGGSGHSDNGSIVISETDLEVPVQEVQIELIESCDFREGKSPQHSTPSIQIEKEIEVLLSKDSFAG